MASLIQRPGPLGKHFAAHLLRRTTYNVTPSRIDDFATKTAEEAVDELFDSTSSGSSYVYPDGPLYGTTTSAPIFSDVNAAHQPGLSYGGNAVTRAVDMWRIFEAKASINATWKIINWIHSVFSVRENGRTFMFHHWRMLHKLAFTNLQDLAFFITVDNLMLFYLNGRDNTAASPNENYSREFLELFTIGKGDAVGVGDYTTYTESDVVTAAKIFTGFRVKTNVVSPVTGIIRGEIVMARHDQGSKTFSHAFQNQVIQGGTTPTQVDDEVKEFIQMVYDKDATAQNFIRKLYRYFVNDKINQEIEDDIIVPLAADLKSSGYDHIAAMKTLFKSLHFYDEDDSVQGDENIGAKIKSPLELLITTSNQLEVVNTSVSNVNNFGHNYTTVVGDHLSNIGMDTRGPTTVEGYPGFNDGPGYSRNWYSSNYLYNRHTFGLSFRRGKVRNTSTYFPFQTNLLTWVVNNIDTADSPGLSHLDPKGAADSEKLVIDMLEYLLVNVPSGDRFVYFKSKLLNGLSPINWYFVWKDYLENGNETDVTIGITKLYDTILSSPEFQIF